MKYFRRWQLGSPGSSTTTSTALLPSCSRNALSCIRLSCINAKSLNQVLYDTIENARSVPQWCLMKYHSLDQLVVCWWHSTKILVFSFSLSHYLSLICIYVLYTIKINFHVIHISHTHVYIYIGGVFFFGIVLSHVCMYVCMCMYIYAYVICIYIYIYIYYIYTYAIYIHLCLYALYIYALYICI